MTVEAERARRARSRPPAKERALRPRLRALTPSRDVPFRIALGRVLIAVLFLVIPVFNPAVMKAGDERLYVGTLVVLGAAILMLPSLQARSFRWIAAGLGFGALYVLEAGLLRGDLSLGVVGNTYRPLHGVLAFTAFVVLLLGADRERWVRLFLAGGLVGCALAVVNTLFPAIDPFAVSEPDLGYESKFLTSSERQSGGFVYPGNFGPYAAYVALLSLIVLERRTTRLLALNLYTAAFVFGVLGMLTSGSRGALLGFLLGAAVVAWRTPAFRVPVIVAVGAAAAIVSLGIVLAGTFREILESRVLLADFSLDERFRSWDMAIEGLDHSALFGAGIFPNTIDSTVMYYLGVGGIVGLVIVAAMYWCTVLRPTRRRDWRNLPILVAVAAVGLTQDALGTPLTSWAIAAAAFLASDPAREREIFATEPQPIRRDRRTAAIAVAVLVGVVAVCVGAFAAGRLPASFVQTTPVLEVSQTVILTREGRSVADGGDRVAVATESSLLDEHEPLWLVVRRGATVDAVRYDFASVVDGGALAEEARVAETARGQLPRRHAAAFDVVRWDAEAAPVLGVMRLERRRVHVATLDGGRAVARGSASVEPVPRGLRREASLAVWSGDVPDLFVVDHASPLRPITVSIYSGESRFERRLDVVRIPRFTSARGPWHVDVARVHGSTPDLVLVTPRGTSRRPEVHIASGESRFGEFLLQIPVELPREALVRPDYVVGTRVGDPVVYAVTPGVRQATVSVVPLLFLPPGD